MTKPSPREKALQIFSIDNYISIGCKSIMFSALAEKQI